MKFLGLPVTDWIQALSGVVIALLTLALVWVTRQYVAANERMAQSLERDFTERYRARLEVDAKVTRRDEWLYSVEACLINRGLGPVSVDRVLVTINAVTLEEFQDLAVAVAQERQLPSVRFSLQGHPGLQNPTEGQRVPLAVEVNLPRRGRRPKDDP